MLDFYKSQGGRRFIDGTVPNLVEAMQSIAMSLGKLTKLAEAAMTKVAAEAPPGVVEGTWEEHPDMPGFFSLQPPPSICGALLHVEAIEVKQESDLQEAEHDHNQSALDALYDLREPGKPLATIEIDGRSCVIYGCPSEQ
jgi:hypothetical protein